MHWLGMFGIGATLVLAVSYAAVSPLPPLPNEAQAEGYRVGTVLGILVLPLLAAYLAAGRRKVRNPNRFAGVFCGVAFVILGLNAAGSISSSDPSLFETAEQKVTRLMREAAGVQPVSRSFFGEDPVDSVLRDMFKEMLAFNKDYQAAIDQFDLSEISKLNTPRAYLDPDSAREGLRQLHAGCDLDALQEQRMQQLIERFRRRIGELGPANRDALISSFDAGLAQNMPVRQRAVAAEKAWITAIDSVYDYAREQHAYFRLSGKQVVVSNGAVLREFNSRVDKMNRSREEFLQAKKDFDALQQKFMQRTGVAIGQSSPR